jgi:hypothetical protein
MKSSPGAGLGCGGNGLALMQTVRPGVHVFIWPGCCYIRGRQQEVDRTQKGTPMKQRNPNKPYLPTEQQIQRKCTSIQRTWSERERRRRTVAREREPQIPFYMARSLGVDVFDLDRGEAEIVAFRH